ncbi:hypothetical protein RUM44_012729 [Polyplax serrata]|uniref:Uncharacterized protein n=1 Tax=Polyplax serrata TaxID=468196 RepID=A0ABR1BGH6_POLSC
MSKLFLFFSILNCYNDDDDDDDDDGADSKKITTEWLMHLLGDLPGFFLLRDRPQGPRSVSRKVTESRTGRPVDLTGAEGDTVVPYGAINPLTPRQGEIM